MNETEKIMQPYLDQIEAGNPPSFGNLMLRYNELFENGPMNVEGACLTFFLKELYPAEFGTAITAKLLALGFPPFVPQF